MTVEWWPVHGVVACAACPGGMSAAVAETRLMANENRAGGALGSRAAGVAMAFKLIESAQARWRAVNAPHLVALVRAGARFQKGKLVERPDESGGDQQVA